MTSTFGRSRFLTFGLIFVASFTLVACGALPNETLADPEPQQIGALTTVSGQQSAVAQQEPAASQPGLAVNAVGRVELAKEYKVSMEAGGKVAEVAVDVGDQVKVGDMLVSLDTANLERAVTRAEIDVESAGIAFEEAGKAIDESDIALAEANLLLAEENLAVVKRGPTQEQLQSLENAAASAWSRYNELKAGPTDAQLNQARANLLKAEVSVQAAQREYDKIAWLPEAAASAAADTLQKATIDLESAKAALEQLSLPAEASELQSALSSAQGAQHNLNELRKKPTEAELADALAKVAAAEANLARVSEQSDADERTAELRVQQALLSLDEAKEELAAAIVLSPIDGTVLDVTVDPGEQVSSGTDVATLAEMSDIKLIVNVEQKDISRIGIGQDVEISIYALPEAAYAGVVEKIAPTSESGTGFVTFPVTIILTDEDLSAVRPGMTASATFVAEAAASE